MLQPAPQNQPHPRRAAVLIAVVVLVVLLALAGYRYTDWMGAEYRAADSSVKAAQARANADAGIHWAAAMLAGDLSANFDNNLYNNPSAFQGILVPNNGNSTRKMLTGRCSLLALPSPDDTSGEPYYFGVTDEAGKININALLALDNGQGTVATQILLALPNMTQDIADNILNWIDPNPRAAGAGNDVYGGMTPPYQAKKGPLDTLEEMLLIAGVTPQLLFGNDQNRNGQLDPGEDDGTGQSNRGWSDYLTVYSREVNLDSTGMPRVYLNDPDLDNLTSNLTTALSNDDMTNFIIAARQYGLSTGSKSGGARPQMSSGDRTAATTQIRASRSGGGSGGGGGGKGQKMSNIKSIFDLINGTVNVPTGTGRTAKTVAYPSPMSDPSMARQLLPILLDKTTTSQQTELTPRINVNTAPQAVLVALQAAIGPNSSSSSSTSSSSTAPTSATPTSSKQGASSSGSGNQSPVVLADSDITTIMNTRPSQSSAATPAAIFQTPAWLYTEANIDPSVLKKLEPYITARTQVYRVQSVGHFDEGGPTARVEAVIDTNQGRPRIIYYRPLTELGKSFDLKNNNK